MLTPPPGPVDVACSELARRLPIWPDRIAATDRQSFSDAGVEVAEADMDIVARSGGRAEHPHRLRLLPLFATFRRAMIAPRPIGAVLALSMRCDRRLILARVEQDRDDYFPPVRKVLEARLQDARDAIDLGDPHKLFFSVRDLDERSAAWLRRSFDLLKISPYREPYFDAEALGAAARAVLSNGAHPVPEAVRAELRALEQVAPFLAARGNALLIEDHWKALTDLATFYVDLGMNLNGWPILRAPSPDPTAIIRGFEHAIVALRRGPAARPLLDQALHSLVMAQQVLGNGRSWSNNGGLTGPLVDFIRNVAALYGLRAAASDSRLRGILSR